ncbi:MAG TPA: patatin-like phospholipase family protein [Verrucomicrobiota bacterium]|nr:patatin [Verrucomicrobiales bacterium]HRI14003.1 patatin-like phospholipase family protein [Verrucomicrobiota bacterium]
MKKKLRRFCGDGLLVWIGSIGLLGSGCIHAPLNAPKDAITSAPGYYFGQRVPESVNANDTLFLVAFSGGGTRAAAMAYGVLEELHRTPVPGSVPERKVSDDINVISAVSGGSVTAAAYALYQDKLFDSFEKEFLKRDVQGKLVAKSLVPWNWPRLASPWFGRSDLAARYYDEILFHGATFSDLNQGRRPFVLLNATEVATGLQFWFTQDIFDNFCSDISSYPISRAVAASSAVPVVLSPITLKSYAGECGYIPPEWLRVDAATGQGLALLQRGRELAELRDRTNRPYFHFVDGGVADNLGLRPLLEGLAYFAVQPASRQGLELESLRRVVLISVNARSSPINNWDRSESPPGMLTLAVAAPSITMDRYSKDTVAMMGMLVQAMKKRLQASNKGSLQFFPITLSFDNLPDPEERRYFLNVPTSFFLSNEAVDRLREVGGRLLRDSPQFQALLRDYANPGSGPPVLPEHPLEPD